MWERLFCISSRAQRNFLVTIFIHARLKRKKLNRKKMEAKRLTRSYNGVIAGVCGGLGNYFNLDPVLVRAIFLLLFLVGGGGLLLYIILWIAVPRDGNYYTPYQDVNPPGNPGAGHEENKTSATMPNNETSATSSNNNMTAYILGIAFILFGVMFLLHKLFYIGLSRLWPVSLIIVGLILIFAYSYNHKKIQS